MPHKHMYLAPNSSKRVTKIRLHIFEVQDPTNNKIQKNYVTLLLKVRKIK